MPMSYLAAMVRSKALQRESSLRRVSQKRCNENPHCDGSAKSVATRILTAMVRSKALQRESSLRRFGQKHCNENPHCDGSAKSVATRIPTATQFKLIHIIREVLLSNEIIYGSVLVSPQSCFRFISIVKIIILKMIRE